MGTPPVDTGLPPPPLWSLIPATTNLFSISSFLSCQESYIKGIMRQSVKDSYCQKTDETRLQIEEPEKTHF